MAIYPHENILRLDDDVCNSSLALTEPSETITITRLQIWMDLLGGFVDEVFGRIFGWTLW